MAKTNVRGTQIADGSSGVDLTVDVFGVLPVANGGVAAGGTSTTFYRGDATWTTVTASPVGLPSYVGARASAWDPVLGTYNWKASNTRNLKTSLATARAGTAAPTWLFIGDSKMSGYTNGSTGNLTAWPRKLGLMIDSLFGGEYSNPGAVLGGVTAADSRWVFGATWASSGVAFQSATSNTSEVYTSLETGTIVEIKYGNWGASFTYSIDGGAAVTVTATGASTCGTVTVTGLADTTHSVAVTRTAAGNPVLYDIGVFKASGIRIANYAYPGTKSADYIATGNGTGSTTAMTAHPSPAVVFMSLGGNDALNSVTLATYYSNMLADIDLYRTLSPQPDIVLLASTEVTSTSPAVNTALWQSYVSKLWDVAEARDLPLIDMTYHGGTDVQGVANGTITSVDGVHETAAGHIFIAQRVNKAISDDNTNEDLPVYRAKDFKAGFPLFVYGNSFSQTPAYYAGQDYPTLLKTEINASALTNYSVQGSRGPDGAYAAINSASLAPGETTTISGATWPGVSTRRGLVIYDMLGNDVSHYSTLASLIPVAITTANTQYLDGLAGCYRTFLAVASSESRVEQGSATFAGTWASQTLAANGTSNGTIARTITNGATASFSITPPQDGPLQGRVFLLTYIVSTALNSTTMSPIGISVDGAYKGFNQPPSWETYSGVGAVNMAQVPYVVPIDLPVDGAAHTVLITNMGVTTSQEMMVDAILVSSDNPNPILVMDHDRVKVGTGGGWTSAQAAVWRANYLMVAPVIRDVVAEFPNAGWVPSTMTPNGLYLVDGVHPNDRGMYQRMNDVITALDYTIPWVKNYLLSLQPDSNFAKV